MRNNPAHPGLEWVVVSKRRIYAIISLLILALGAGLYSRQYGNSANATHEASRVVEGVRFDFFEGEVRVLRAATRETILVDAQTRLFPGDIVQTQAAGRAVITLSDGSTLTIRPNSVVTIAENIGDAEGKHRRVRVTVERGQLRVSTEKQNIETGSTVETLLTKNHLSTKTAASFDVHEDNSEEIRVSAGDVESSIGGNRTTIHGGEYVSLNKSGDIKRRELLLDAPIPYAPANLERIQMHVGGNSGVSLQWSHPMTATAPFYQVEIALSPFFVRPSIIFERERLVAPNLIVTQLRPGSYFWRVRALSPTGQTSEWSEPQKFILTSAA